MSSVQTRHSVHEKCLWLSSGTAAEKHLIYVNYHVFVSVLVKDLCRLVLLTRSLPLTELSRQIIMHQ